MRVKWHPALHLSPVHIIPKGDPKNPRGVRLIVNNSYPEGISVNDIIPDSQKKCHLDSFQNIVSWVMSLGPDGWVAARAVKPAQKF